MLWVRPLVTAARREGNGDVIVVVLIHTGIACCGLSMLVMVLQGNKLLDQRQNKSTTPMQTTESCHGRVSGVRTVRRYGSRRIGYRAMYV